VIARTKIVILAGLNALLVAGLLIGLLAPGRQSGQARPLLPAAALEAIEVRLVTGTQEIHLARNGRWELVVDDRRFPARFDRIELFLDGLRRSRVVRRVTDDPTLHDRLGVSDTTGRLVTIGTGHASWSLVFGAPAELPGSLAVRETDDGTVWLAESSADFYLRQTPSFWAYLRLFPERARPADVVHARIEREGAASFELTRDADGWSMDIAGRQSRADQHAVADVARRLVDVVGNGSYEGTFAELEAVLRFSFSLADGRTFGCEIGFDGTVYVARPWGPDLPGDPYGGLMYTLEEASFRRLVPEPSAMLTAGPRSRSAA
jgi:hypothetical protein